MWPEGLRPPPNPPDRFHGRVEPCDAGYFSIALMKNIDPNSIGLMCSPGGSRGPGDGGYHQDFSFDAIQTRFSGSEPAPPPPSPQGAGSFWTRRHRVR